MPHEDSNYVAPSDIWIIMTLSTIHCTLHTLYITKYRHTFLVLGNQQQCSTVATLDTNLNYTGLCSTLEASSDRIQAILLPKLYQKVPRLQQLSDDSDYQHTEDRRILPADMYPKILHLKF